MTTSFKTLVLLPLAICVTLSGTSPAQTAKDRPVKRKPDLPVILIYWIRGYSMTPPPEELQFAVWSDGRILWRETPRRWVKVGSKWQWNETKHFEATIPPERVRKAMEKLEAAQVKKASGLTHVVVDGSYNTIVVRGKSGLIVMQSSEDPGSQTKGANAWKIIQDVARSLVPKKGVAIKPPDFDRWRESRQSGR